MDETDSGVIRADALCTIIRKNKRLRHTQLTSLGCTAAHYQATRRSSDIEARLLS